MREVIIQERLERILESIILIKERTNNLEKAIDLVRKEDGGMLLDSVALRLQVIGEHVKKIDTLDPSIFIEKIQSKNV